MADPHGHLARVGDLAEQPQQHHLLLERLEDGRDAAREVDAEAREVGRAREHDPLLALLDQGLEQGGQQRGHRRAVLGR